MQTSFPRTLIAGAALATVVGLLVSLVSGYSVMRTLDDSHGKVSRLLTLRSEILLHDETLTASTLLAASTGDQRWINRYRQIEPQLGAAIDATIALADDALVDQAAQRTEQANNALVDLEEQALSLVANGQSEAAMGLIQSPRYERYKSAYILGMDSLSEHVEASAATASLAVAGTRRVALVAGLVTLTLLVVLWIAVLHRLGVWRAELDREARLLYLTLFRAAFPNSSARRTRTSPTLLRPRSTPMSGRSSADHDARQVGDREAELLCGC